jgi:hypothetical protein
MKYLIATLFLIAVCGSTGFAVTYQVGRPEHSRNCRTSHRCLIRATGSEVDGNATYPGDLIFTRPAPTLTKLRSEGFALMGYVR